MKNLLSRLRQMGFLMLVGIFVIMYAALAITYFGQKANQSDLMEQIDRLRGLTSRPLPSAEKLREEYEKVNLALRPVATPNLLSIIVGIAEASGIDVSPGSDKFNVPPPAPPREVKMEKDNYRVLGISGIMAQGDQDSVMAFISNLDFRETLKTTVLRNVQLKQVEITYTGEEEARRTEYRNVQSAVIALMTNSNLTTIPNPKDYAGGAAINDMTDFPDAVSSWDAVAAPLEGKETDPDGNSYAEGDKAGYILYGHDITGDGAQTGLVNYVTMTKTRYHYTCEADGTIRQFSKPDVATAYEYVGSEATTTETIVILDVEVYEKPMPDGKEKNGK